jgi:replication factor A1
LEHSAEKIGDPQQMDTSSDQAVESPAVNQKPTPSTSAAPAVPTPEIVQTASTSRPQAPARNARFGNIYPIEGLSPYQNNWTIKARVTQKSEIKTWSNPRGEGKLFNVTLMDDSGEIRGTGFNLVCDELYPRLEEGKVYYISKARVNLAKKKFSNVNNDYELGFERNTEVEEVSFVFLYTLVNQSLCLSQCHEVTNLPSIKYNFVALDALESLNKDAICGEFPFFFISLFVLK